MKARARAAIKPVAKLIVRARGTIHRVTYDQSILDEHLETQRKRILDTYEGADKPGSNPASWGVAGSTRPLSFLETFDDRKYKDLSDELDEWTEKTRKAFDSAVLRNYIASAFAPVSLEIVNTDKTFLHGVDVRVRLEREIFGMVSGSNTTWSLAEMLPRLPPKWGPKPRQSAAEIMAPLHQTPSAFDYSFFVAIQLGARAGGSQGPVVKSSVSAWYLSLPHLVAVAR
jgi:hypothetical protein